MSEMGEDNGILLRARHGDGRRVALAPGEDYDAETLSIVAVRDEAGIPQGYAAQAVFA